MNDASSDRGFFVQPRGLSILFFTEMWERFSFYGMRALLILYLTASAENGGLAFDAAKAAAIYALYTSSVYLMGLPGGWLADRFLGQRRAVFYGGILIMAGHICLAFAPLAAFYTGLVLLVLGTGLLKPNISVMVGQLYSTEDDRRDAGFSIFYMGINFGALAGPLICNYLGESVDWHLGFGVAAIGMFVGLIQYMLGGKHLGNAGLAPTPAESPEAARKQKNQLVIGSAVILALIALMAMLVKSGTLSMDAEAFSNAFGIFLLALTVGFFAWLFAAGNWSPIERGRLGAIVMLFIAASFFWGAYEQAGSSLNLFARDFTDRSIFGREFPAGWFQSVPALFVIIQAPIFAWLWVRMGKRQPSSPMKFTLGLIFVGLGFLVMMLAASQARAGVPVGPQWLFLTYFLHVIGEMCLSPVGLSTVTKLAPARVTSLMMGVWFLASAVGNYLGGRAAGFYETLPLWGLFGAVAGVSIGGGLMLALLVKPIRRMMAGVH
jgi:POT family proton-dependent oligopeptide transporter